MALDYKILAQDLISYTTVTENTDTTSYYVTYEETSGPMFVSVPNPHSQGRYSTDGINWSNMELPQYTYWEAVAYGNGKFVAISESVSAYSTDGVTWSLSSLPASAAWNILTYGGGMFVAGCFDNMIYSTDGINWSTASLVPPAAYRASIAYREPGDGLGYFLVINQNGSLMTSTDGNIWNSTSSSFPSTSNYSPLVWAQDKYKFVTIRNGYSMYSTDGLSWTVADNVSGYFFSMAYGNGTFVAVGEYGSLAYSQNGINWTSVSMPDAGQVNGTIFSYSITYGNGKFIAPVNAFNGSTYINAFIVSTDGISWTVEYTPELISTINQKIAYGQVATLTEKLNIIGGQGTTQTEEFLPVTVYTVPANKSTIVTSIFIANHNNTASTYDLAVVPAGESLSLRHHMRWDYSVAANDFDNITTKITMSAGDKLVVFPSTVDTLSITAFGVEQ